MVCATTYIDPTKPEAEILLLAFAWSGEFSGSAYYEALRTLVAPCLIGEADVLFFWEDGSPTAIRFCNGKAIDCDIAYTLTPRG